jgi:hypothetical protein
MWGSLAAGSGGNPVAILGSYTPAVDRDERGRMQIDIVEAANIDGNLR